MSATVEDVCKRDGIAITPPAEREESLAVIVPVYNEEGTVAELLRHLEVQPCVSQIIIVDDGSTDRTWQELEPWGVTGTIDLQNASENCRQESFVVGHSIAFMHRDGNRGKGPGIRERTYFVPRARIISMDADMECNPADIRKLCDVREISEAHVVSGGRFNGLFLMKRHGPGCHSIEVSDDAR